MFLMSTNKPLKVSLLQGFFRKFEITTNQITMTNLEIPTEIIPEIWVPIKRYEKLYRISTLGRVKRINKTSPERILKPSFNKKGYYIVSLSKKDVQKTKPIHRLVATHFIPRPRIKSYSQTNHINGIKTDNRVENLEWCTASYNTLHAYRLGLINTKLRKPYSQWQKRTKIVSSEGLENQKRHIHTDNQLIKYAKRPKHSSNLPHRTD